MITVRSQYDKLNRLGLKQLFIINMLLNYFTPQEVSALIDEIEAEKEWVE